MGGLRQIIQNLTVESLLQVNDDGTLRPWLAERWSVAANGTSIDVKLRQGARFHDGSAADAKAIAGILARALSQTMGPGFDDVESVRPKSIDQIQIKLRRPSPFVLEALVASIEKGDKGKIGTGPFLEADGGATVRLKANRDYYMGRPSVSEVTINPYPSVRAAWADLLRGRVDMLYDVPTDALDSLEASTRVSVFTFPRRYQYAIVLNTASPSLRPAAVRRGLNAAIDRSAIVREALRGHGTGSIGPVWPKNWAFDNHLPKLALDYTTADAELPHGPKESRNQPRLVVRCLVPADSVYDRVALVTKQQLESLNVELALIEKSPAEVASAVEKHEFEAVLIDLISGPNVFRLYQWWHTGGALNFARFSSPSVDAALDQIRHASNDDQYRAGVAAFQRAMLDDPPAIFLAWGERARAVSNRFVVPSEPGQDIVGSMYRWHLRPGATVVNPN
jgi:peptide/nickel transport system substrate-binding protein